MNGRYLVSGGLRVLGVGLVAVGTMSLLFSLASLVHPGFGVVVASRPFGMAEHGCRAELPKLVSRMYSIYLRARAFRDDGVRQTTEKRQNRAMARMLRAA